MSIESDADLKGLERAGQVVADTLKAMKRAVEPGISTCELDRIGLDNFKRYGAVSVAHFEHSLIITRGKPIILTAA